MAKIVFTSHPASDAMAREDEFDRWLASRPHCRKCHNHIQDNNYYYLEGFYFCRSCVRESEGFFDDEIDDGFME